MKKEMEELRDQSVAELKNLHQEENRKLFDLVNEMRTTKKKDKPHRIGQAKRRIARILTVLQQKESA